MANYDILYLGRKAEELGFIRDTLAWGKAWRMIVRIAQTTPTLFYHWQRGIKPTIG